MKLWKMTRLDKVWYDEYQGFIIRAESEARAREMASQTRGDEGGNTWIDPLKSSCEELNAEGVEEIIASDFNAG